MDSGSAQPFNGFCLYGDRAGSFSREKFAEPFKIRQFVLADRSLFFGSPVHSYVFAVYFLKI